MMIDIKEATISRVTLQRVGHKVREEANIKATSYVDMGESEEEELTPFLLKSMTKAMEMHHFIHFTGQVEFNVLYKHCLDAFTGEIDFLNFSNQVLELLYERSEHPQIKSGELFITMVEGIKYKEDIVQGIGIFKLENKSKFIRFKHTDKVEYAIQRGHKLTAIDKGALILNTETEDGYRALSIDDNQMESEYWKKKFLDIDNVQDNAYQTRNYIKLLNDFSKEIIGEEQGRKAQTEFISNGLQLFEHNEVITHDFLEDNLLKNYETQEQFRVYKQQYAEDRGLELLDKFEISESAYNYQKRKIKSEIKLDTDIHIKLDVNKPESTEDYIERGFDEERKMYYYKIFFNTEE